MMAKSLLPRFGGSAAVWITCMLFFQVVLLLGYLYSFCITRYLPTRVQALVHLGLLALSLGALPLRPRLETANDGPTAALLLMLVSLVGLPYFVLSATSPLLQSWFAGAEGRFPYRLFAVSNAASLLALLAYPVAIEPFLATPLQIDYWSRGYMVLLVLLGTTAAVTLVRARRTVPVPAVGSNHRPWLWIALAACASTLWLAITNYLGQEVAAMPLLWVVPMGIYLLSFILCFESDRWYRPALFRWLMPAAWIAIGSRIGFTASAGGLQWEVPILCAALLICCTFCHGELARSKPPAQDGLTFFYLMVASGGALGGIFVALVAPSLFRSFLELPLAVTASVFLALYFLFGYRSPRRLIRLGVVAALAFVVSTQYHADRDVRRTRNFYGVLQIRDIGDGDTAARAMYSGRTLHGLEFLSPGLRRTPTTYYGVQSGVGLTFGALRNPNRRVAIVGLGAGTLASYGRGGDFFRFYEINPAVIRAAAESFEFLRDSAAATGVVQGDGRLMLAREPAHSFDIVVLDAFSDDAIPIHLLTREAFQVYFDRLRPGGLLLVHLTNRYLDLRAEVEAVAGDLGKQVLCIHSEPDPARRTEAADWAIVASDARELGMLRPYAQPPAQRILRPWSDEYSSLFELWK